MRICAVLLNYFGWQDSAHCCKALAGQLDHITVVENSASAQEQQALTDACSTIPNVEIIASDKNLGFAAGVNVALRRMLPQEFDAFLVINNDTVVSDDFIEKLSVGAHSQMLDIAAPVIYRYQQKNRLWSKGNYYNIWTGFITQNPLPLPGNFFYLPGCCLLIKPVVFKTIGLFDEDFFLYGEDVAFCYKAQTHGFRYGVVADAILYHKTGSASAQNPAFYEEHIARAHLMLVEKLISPKAWLLAFCLKLHVLLARACLRCIRCRNLSALTGCLRGVRKELSRFYMLCGRTMA